MDQTLYEIAEDFDDIMVLMEDATDPNPPCTACNARDSERLPRDLRKSAAGEDWVPCELCDDTGFVEAMDDEGFVEAMDEALKDLELNLREKTENIIRLCASWDAMSASVKIEEQRLAAKRKAYDAKRDRLRKYMAIYMAKIGQKKIETSVKNATLQTGREVVVIDDVDKLPQGTFNTQYVITADKKIIAERLKKKIETAGAHLHRNDDFVVFR